MKLFYKLFIGVMSILGLLFISSCATLYTNPQKTIEIISEPEQAEIVITSEKGQIVFKGNTPTYVNLPRKSSYSVKISTPGFKPVELQIKKRFQFLTLGNVAMTFFMPIGVAVDYYFDTIWTLSPSNISISLERTSLKYGASELIENYAVVTLLDQDQKERKIRIALEPG